MLPGSDAVVAAITERAAYLTGYPSENVEPLQLVKYTPGQRYEPHFDYGEACDFEENMANGHRHVTMLVYLNDVPEEAGGHTTFPNMELKVSPRAGHAIVFNDCHFRYPTEKQKPVLRGISFEVSRTFVVSWNTCKKGTESQNS